MHSPSCVKALQYWLSVFAGTFGNCFVDAIGWMFASKYTLNTYKVLHYHFDFHLPLFFLFAGSSYMARGTCKTGTPAAKKTPTSRDEDATSAVVPLQKKSRETLENENVDLRRQLSMTSFFIHYLSWSPAEQLQALRNIDESFVHKPKGQAGRGDGYNLYDEMRLSSTTTYNVIRVWHFFVVCAYSYWVWTQNVVRVIGSLYLDLRLTWSKQDPKAKDAARKEVCYTILTFV